MDPLSHEACLLQPGRRLFFFIAADVPRGSLRALHAENVRGYIQKRHTGIDSRRAGFQLIILVRWIHKQLRGRRDNRVHVEAERLPLRQANRTVPVVVGKMVHDDVVVAVKTGHYCLAIRTEPWNESGV